MDKGTGMERTITHWTGGGWFPTALDKQHYHLITDHDGQIHEGNHSFQDNIVTADDDYAAHTLGMNTRSAGMAMCGMLNAKESPFEPGPYPIGEKQFRAHCIMLARFHAENGIPVTPRTCLTHAEVQGTLGVKQRGKWDIARLPWNDQIRGARAVGDYMREIVLEAQGHPAMGLVMQVETRPTLRKGIRGLVEIVRSLQKALAGLGFFSGLADGDFGTLTEDAVIAFQTHNGLKKDGIFGPKSWAALDVAEPLPLRAPITKKELIERGSETAKDGDLVMKAGMGLGGLGGVTTAISVVQETQEKVVQIGQNIGGIQGNFISIWGLLQQLWLPILITVVAVGLFFAGRRIVRNRIRAHVTGEHKGLL